MKILLVAGARPNFMKIASIIDAIDTHNRGAAAPLAYCLVHTGQHYDDRMSSAFFRDLALPQPHVDLEVGSLSHAQQTAEIMKRFEPVLLSERPDVVLVVGDVNSTIACVLVAAKIIYPQTASGRQRLRPLIAHVEAGLRSYDRSMPEEINRILTDALSDVLFITEESAGENLLREGVAREKIHFVGNTMVDTLLRHKEKAQQSDILQRLGLMRRGAAEGTASRNSQPGPGHYAVVTLHRPSNVDDASTFRHILVALAEVAKTLPIFFPVHPRTLGRIKEFGLESYCVFPSEATPTRAAAARIHCLEPLGYLDFLCLMSSAKVVLTDSGGIQEETTGLGIPCVTLRQNTERPITLTQGTNVLAGTQTANIIREALLQLAYDAQPRRPEGWDGHAGERIVNILVEQGNGDI